MTKPKKIHVDETASKSIPKINDRAGQCYKLAYDFIKDTPFDPEDGAVLVDKEDKILPDGRWEDKLHTNTTGRQSDTSSEAGA